METVISCVFFCFQKLANSNQAWPECHIIIYMYLLLPSYICSSSAILGNIGPRSFFYGPHFAQSVLPWPQANIPQYSPCASSVRDYYRYFLLYAYASNLMYFAWPNHNYVFLLSLLWSHIIFKFLYFFAAHQFKCILKKYAFIDKVLRKCCSRERKLTLSNKCWWIKKLIMLLYLCKTLILKHQITFKWTAI